jgi:hypothetical protein
MTKLKLSRGGKKKPLRIIRRRDPRDSTRFDLQVVKTLIETTWQGFDTKMTKYDARVERGYCGSIVTGVHRVNLPRFDRSRTWADLRQQFGAEAAQNN